jgi:GrpB-like predicted nucleotidyltransferase (UPF0157 family)
VVTVDPILSERLSAIGVDPRRLGDPGDTWRKLRARYGPLITLGDRYALEAAHRRVAPRDLPQDVRSRLTAEVLAVQFPGLQFVAGSERSIRDPVEVVSYDVDWPHRFAAWRERLRAALRGVAVRVEHVGSTAVPGLASKPVIDIQVSVASVADEATYVDAIERSGVALRSREPGHRYFRPSGDLPRDVQIHVCEAGSAWERDHILFRDYLRAHPEVRDAYGRLKLKLAEDYREDRIAYTDAKTAFILDALDAASQWAEETGWRLPTGI